MKLKKSVLGITLALGMLIAALSFSPSAHADSSTDGNSFWTGTWSKHYNHLDLAPSLQGDILFGYDNGCNYGAFSHTALVAQGSSYSNGAWDGPIVESTDRGSSNSVITTGKQSDFQAYDAASLTFFNKKGYKFSGSSVVKNALNHSGPYSWLASYTSNDKWYCSKLVSRAVHDYNGYNLGFVVNGSLITPAAVWYDSALGQRSKSVSSAYDGGSVWAASKTEISSIAGSASSTKSPEISYKGVEVAAIHFNAEDKKLIDARLNEEKAAGKNDDQNTDNTIVLPDAKPGLMEYLSSLYHSGVSKEEIQKKWNVSDDEMAQIH
jgi:hypothetical protein